MSPRARAAPFAMMAREDDGRRVALITFLPELAASEKGHEVVFLLDCSGSMSGSSIHEAKRALQLCIRALGPADRFDVVCFGSSHHALWGKARAFDDASLEAATRHVQSIDATLGGTEILAPLREILARPRTEGLARRVLMLTDGQVANEAEVIALAREHAAHTRIFAFGIGAGASEHLVRGVARASRGAAEMLAPGERIEPKVMRTFSRVRSPVLDDVRVEWGAMRVEQAPQRTPPVFAGDALTVLARIESGSASEVALVAGEHRWTASIDLERASSGGAIPVLWARERIRELEDASERRGSAQVRPEREAQRARELVELGVRYGLVSSATSYVAIEERSAEKRTAEAAALRRVPVAITSGWGGHGRAASGLAVPAGAAFGAPPPPPSAPMPAPRMEASRMAAPPAPFAAAKKSAPGILSRIGDAMFGGGARPAAEERVAAAPSADRVFDLLMTQKASGAFARSSALEAWLGAARVAKLEALLGASDEAVVITSLVLALLAAEARDRESEWRPAADKARAWLAGRTADVSAVL